MKFLKKTLIALSILGMSVAAIAQQTVIYAPVLSVEPVHKMFSSYELSEPICRTVTVPIERRLPVHREVVTQGNPVLGIIVGAVIGNQLFQGGDGSRTAGTILGSAVGHTLTDDRRHIVTEYHTEIHYVEKRSCERESQFVTRPVLDGYNVTYEYQGTIRQIFMKRHPGANVRIVTTYRIEP